MIFTNLTVRPYETTEFSEFSFAGITWKDEYLGLVLDYEIQQSTKRPPCFVETGYFHELTEYINRQILSYGIDTTPIKLTLESYEIEITGNSNTNLNFPLCVTTSFEFNGEKIFGPFIAGHPAGFSMVMSQDSPRATYARNPHFVLHERFNPIFNDDSQTEFLAKILSELQAKMKNLIISFPNRYNTPEDFWRSGITRVMMGGNISDGINEGLTPRLVENNNVRFLPFSVSRNCNIPSGFDSDKLVLYGGLAEENKGFYQNEDFLKLLIIIRGSAAMFREEYNEKYFSSPAFTPERNSQLFTSLLELLIKEPIP
jgi:hypothetical protein